jgi:hypothetical protein
MGDYFSMNSLKGGDYRSIKKIFLFPAEMAVELILTISQLN